MICGATLCLVVPDRPSVHKMSTQACCTCSYRLWNSQCCGGHRLHGPRSVVPPPEAGSGSHQPAEDTVQQNSACNKMDNVGKGIKFQSKLHNCCT